VEVRVWESKLASFGFMGVKFWLQNLHAQFTERSVPVIFSSMQKVDSSVQNAKVSIFQHKSAENASLRYWEKIC
jgi:uncharacterized protein YbcC (UPF0753/DUF2309 family)